MSSRLTKSAHSAVPSLGMGASSAAFDRSGYPYGDEKKHKQLPPLPSSVNRRLEPCRISLPYSDRHGGAGED